jgi:hypothetical protein
LTCKAIFFRTILKVTGSDPLLYCREKNPEKTDGS